MAVISENVTLGRPVMFFISGFSNIPHAKYYYVFLSMVYVVTVLGNSFIMCVISLARKLHTAKYIAVFHLALSDLCGSSALVPKLIDTFLFNHQDISFEACLTNMFFVYHFMNMQSMSLLLLAFDRFVAICFPFQYNVVVTKTVMLLFIAVMWSFSLTFFSVHVSLLNRLSFCRSTVLDTYYCDYGPVFKLACNDASLHALIAKMCICFLIFTPLILMFISYFCITLVLFKIPHGVKRIKAMKTCSSHLMLVALFYLPVLSNNIAYAVSPVDTNTRIINNSLTQTIPPMLNPIIYTLKTEEVLQSIRDLYKRRKVDTSTKCKTQVGSTKI